MSEEIVVDLLEDDIPCEDTDCKHNENGECGDPITWFECQHIGPKDWPYSHKKQ